jgi:hypothetical protein
MRYRYEEISNDSGSWAHGTAHGARPAWSWLTLVSLDDEKMAGLHITGEVMGSPSTSIDTQQAGSSRVGYDGIQHSTVTAEFITVGVWPSPL